MEKSCHPKFCSPLLWPTICRENNESNLLERPGPFQIGRIARERKGSLISVQIAKLRLATHKTKILSLRAEE